MGLSAQGLDLQPTLRMALVGPIARSDAGFPIGDMAHSSCYHVPKACFAMPVRARRLIDQRSGLKEAGGHFVQEPDARRIGPLPSAAGVMTRLAYAHAKEARIEVEPILKKAGLTQHQIEDPSVRLRVRDQISFLNLVASALQDDLFGFHLAQPADLREMGFLYYVLASSEMLGEALQRAARYGSIVNEGIALRYVDGRDVCIRFDYVGVSRHVDRHQIEFLVTAVVRICRQLTSLRIVPAHVRFTHRQKGDCYDFLRFFGCEVEFGAAVDEVAFTTTITHMPVVSADPYLNKFLVSYCEEAHSRRLTNRGPFRSSVENAVVPLLPHGKARAGEIARRLGVSQRTLARRLSLEGLTFSDLVESLRSDLAERYLTEEDLSISQIAWLLGYQEVSAFTHAFKRWTSKTPRQARSRAA
jgi:AraC-like DNA-binding protein